MDANVATWTQMSPLSLAARPGQTNNPICMKNSLKSPQSYKLSSDISYTFTFFIESPGFCKITQPIFKIFYGNYQILGFKNLWVIHFGKQHENAIR